VARRSPLALLQFTSGSSGTPKGVRVTQENLIDNIRSFLGWLRVTPDDACSSWLPLFHDMGLIGTFLGSVVAQIDLWLMSPVDFVRSPARWLECHGRLGATITSAPNFGYGYAAQRTGPEELAGMDFGRWRAALAGAERIDPRVFARFTAALASHGFRATALAPCYGLAESTLAVSGVVPGSSPRIVRVAGPLRTGEPVDIAEQGTLGVDCPDDSSGWLTSCGAPVPGATVQIVDGGGAPLPAGHFGEIRVSGGSVAAGYRSPDPGASAAFTADGLRTGDSGVMLGGEVFVVGRVGDSLKARGRKVHAEDLELALSAVPGIRPGRCLVALGDHDGAGHALLMVESTDTSWLDGALAVVRAAIDEAVRVTVVAAGRGSIPRTSSGKPQRRLVWRQLHEELLPGDVVYRSAGDRAAVPTHS
jgi:acyl-CoA synthetase (AMP-forming)/AMP-acid ligase II